MTVLSGGLSDGHLWDWERRRDTFAGLDYKLPVPMLPMTAEDLGGWTGPDGAAQWPVATCDVADVCHKFGVCADYLF